MAEELDPGDALRQLLEERERAKRAVYAAHMAREKAEEELAHSEKLFKMEIEEAQKLAAELAQERAENEAWRTERLRADEEVARERNEFKERAEKAETREKILETILGRIEDELHDAILEEDEFDPLEANDNPMLASDESGMTEKEGDAYLKAYKESLAKFDDYVEDMKREEALADGDQMPFSHFGMTPARAIVAAARIVYRHWRVASFAVAAPFALMTLALGLASAGVYVDAFRPLWSPWPDDAVKWAIGLLGTSVFTFFPLNSLLKTRRIAATTAITGVSDQTRAKLIGPAVDGPPAEHIEEEAAGRDAYLETLREIFGEDDDDEKDEGTPDEE